MGYAMVPLAPIQTAMVMKATAKAGQGGARRKEIFDEN